MRGPAHGVSHPRVIVAPDAAPLRVDPLAVLRVVCYNCNDIDTEAPPGDCCESLVERGEKSSYSCLRALHLRWSAAKRTRRATADTSDCTSNADCGIGEVCSGGLCVEADTGPDVDDTDVDAPDVPDIPDTDDTDTDAPDVPDVPDADIEEVDVEPACDPGEYQCDCFQDVDCDSNLCISTAIGDLCSRLCESDADCSDDGSWECRIVGTSQTDVQEICVPVVSNLCKHLHGEPRLRYRRVLSGADRRRLLRYGLR